MNRKLFDNLIGELTFLTIGELQDILEILKTPFDGDRYDTIEYIAKYHDDEEILPLLPKQPPLILEDKRSVPEKIAELRDCYTKTENNCVENVVRSRGRKKSQNGTLKDRVFEALNNGATTYEDVLKSGIVNIAENTFKTILSQWRKENGIKVTRGRKKGGLKDEN